MQARIANRKSRGFTLVELLVVIAIIGILIALLLPAVQAAREAARRIQCANHLKQISLGLLNYESTHKRFPPGSNSGGSLGGWTYDILAIAHTGEGGTSWMLCILPFTEQQVIYDRWDFSLNASQNAAAGQADIPTFYCPSRRSAVEEYVTLMFDGWTEGGTDYGGCIGAGNMFGDASTSGYGPYNCNHYIVGEANTQFNRPEFRGIFYPNVECRLKDVTDGTSHTFMIGELQRLDRPDVGCHRVSQDGWAVGGVGTLFTARSGFLAGGTGATGGINNNFYESPGSEHPGGAQFGMADGSVTFVSEDVDLAEYSKLGTCSGDEVGSLGTLLD